MKRSYMRRTRMSRKPKPNAYNTRPRDTGYLLWLKTQQCRVAVELGTTRYCEGVMTAAHVGERGVGRKCPDSQSVSLCYGHGVTDAHFFGRGQDGKHGFFAAMDKHDRADWYDREIAACWSGWLAERGEL